MFSSSSLFSVVPPEFDDCDVRDDSDNCCVAGDVGADVALGACGGAVGPTARRANESSLPLVAEVPGSVEEQNW